MNWLGRGEVVWVFCFFFWVGLWGFFAGSVANCKNKVQSELAVLL